MKLDAMTLGTIAFAAFAAYTTLKLKPAAAITPKTAADIAFGQAKAQRQEVGAATWQNLLNTGWINLNPSQMTAYSNYTDSLKAQNIL